MQDPHLKGHPVATVSLAYAQIEEDNEIALVLRSSEGWNRVVLDAHSGQQLINLILAHQGATTEAAR